MPDIAAARSSGAKDASEPDYRRRWWSRDRLTGLIAYPAGDAVAQVILGEFSTARVLVLSIVGAVVYGFEIPRWFAYIHRKFSHPVARTALAMAYFNPLWIGRHLFVIAVALNPGLILSAHEIWSVLVSCVVAGAKSFGGALILSVLGNYVIQTIIPLRYRFLGSSIFSGIMAVYYALSRVVLLGTGE